MRTLINLGALVFASTLSVSAFADAEAEKKKPVVITAPAFWCPFACDSKAKDLGFQTEIIKASLESQGFKVEYKNLPYDRAISDLKKGKLDAITGPFREEVPFATFPENISSATIFCVYTSPKSKWKYTGPKSYQGKS